MQVFSLCRHRGDGQGEMQESCRNHWERIWNSFGDGLASEKQLGEKPPGTGPPEATETGERLLSCVVMRNLRRNSLTALQNFFDLHRDGYIVFCHAKSHHARHSDFLRGELTGSFFNSLTPSQRDMLCPSQARHPPMGAGTRAVQRDSSDQVTQLLVRWRGGIAKRSMP